FVLEPKKKKAKKEMGQFIRIRTGLIILFTMFVVLSSLLYEKNKLKRRQAAADIVQLREIADIYIWQQGGKCPENIEEVFKQQYGDKLKNSVRVIDPWGKKYEIICPGKKNNGSVDIYSAGPDGNFYTYDDLKL
ncbi:MAG: type II secretion system protein GspG, partial [Candidatus Omnitrophica bacterium]|nr:type II secretion system protein GspG [Candidatus Omnitrophota bacterium]